MQAYGVGPRFDEAEFAERGVHAFDLTADGDRVAGRELRSNLIHDPCDLVGDATEIGALHVCVNVEDRLHVGVTLHCRRLRALKRNDVAQQLRMRRISARQRCRRNRIH